MHLSSPPPPPQQKAWQPSGGPMKPNSTPSLFLNQAKGSLSALPAFNSTTTPSQSTGRYLTHPGLTKSFAGVGSP